MSPSPVIETLSPDLTARLQRVGASLTDNAVSRRSTRPAMSAGDPAPNPRPRRGMLAALVVAVTGLAVGTLTFGGRTNDPVIGVIPKSITHRDILWMHFNVPVPEDLPQWYTLVSVNGTDVMIAEKTVNDDYRDSSSLQVEIAGRKVSLIESDRHSLASWTLDNKRGFGLSMAPKNTKFRATVEAAVRASDSQEPAPLSPTTFAAEGMEEVERWDLRVPSLLIDLKRATGGASNEPGISSVFSQEMPTTDAIAQRMFAASGMTVQAFRFDRFLVGASATDRDVRPLRLSEFRRVVRAIDRDRAAEIKRASWEPMARGVSFALANGTGSPYGTCVRTSTEVACSPWLLNRLLGSRWVYTTVGVRDVRVNGVLQKSSPVTGPQGETQRIFIFPASVKSIVTTTSPNGRDLVERTVTRPTF